MSTLKSMTAYGSSSCKTEVGIISIELQSYNRKHLDIRVQAPSECSQFTIPIQKKVAEHVSRGSVTVRVDIEYLDETPFTISSNLPLAREYKKAVLEVEGALDLSSSTLLETLLTKSSQVFQVKGKGVEISAIEEPLEKALQNFMAMREYEGEILKKDLQERIGKLQEGIREIERLSKGCVEEEKQKLLTLFKDLKGIEEEKEAALIREITLFADKIDIQEELTRFQTHLDHFLKTLDRGESVGKTLDFLVQELLREVNTIGSKTPSNETSSLVVEMKAEIERIREQVQNIE